MAGRVAFCGAMDSRPRVEPWVKPRGMLLYRGDDGYWVRGMSGSIQGLNDWVPAFAGMTRKMRDRRPCGAMDCRFRGNDWYNGNDWYK